MVLVFFRRQCLHTSTAPNTSRAVTTASKDKHEVARRNQGDESFLKSARVIDATYSLATPRRERLDGRTELLWAPLPICYLKKAKSRHF